MKAGWKVMFLIGFFVAGVLGGTDAFARGSAEQKPTAPPYGLATQGDAAGTKLYGVVEVEYYDPYGIRGDCAWVRAVLRVRKGNNVSAFYVPPDWVYTSAMAVDPTLGCGGPNQILTGSAGAVQIVLLKAFQPQVLGTLFPGDPTLNMYLKSVGDLGDAFYPNVTPSPAGGYLNIFHVLDVEFAVH